MDDPIPERTPEKNQESVIAGNVAFPVPNPSLRAPQSASENPQSRWALCAAIPLGALRRNPRFFLSPLRWRLMLVAVGALAYCNSPLGQYCYDDVPLIFENKAIESWHGMAKLFSPGFCVEFGDLRYRPVAAVTYFLDGALFHKDPFYSRLVNVALHIAVALALFGLWRSLFDSEGLAFLAAAVFVCHPITTETANDASFRTNTVSLLLSVWTLRVLAGVIRERFSPWRGAPVAAGLWFLALLTKEPAVVVLLLAPILFLRSPATRGGLWPVGQRPVGQRPMNRKKARRLAVVALCLALSLALALIPYLMWSHQGFRTPWPGGRGPALGFLNFCRTFAGYMRLWVAPVGLSVGHYFEPSATFGDGRLWGGAAAFLAFAACSAWAYGRGKIAGVGGLWVCISLLPVAQIIPSPEIFAERYFYMPHAGMSLGAAAMFFGARKAIAGRAGWTMGKTGLRRRAVIAWDGAAVAGIVVLMALTFVRNFDWADNATLNIRRYELWNNAEGRLRLGSLYFAYRHDDETAIRYLKEAVAMDPRSADAYRILGAIHMARGETQQGRACVEKAFDLAPHDEKARRAYEQAQRMETTPRK